MDDIAFALPPENFTPEGVEAPPGLAFDAVGRPAVTDACTRGAAKLLIGLGYAPLAEVPLPNGRRADLMALDQKGRIAIVEVKSSLEDYRADAKWPEYAPFCDRFFFAVNCDFPRSVLPTGCGLIICDGFGGEVMIPAVETPLAPARRKALTLHIARLAAWRALR